MPKIGYQVYSAREDAQRDLSSTLHIIGEMGYDGVEFAGFYGYDADQVATMLRDAHLVAAGSHVPFNQIRQDPDAVIAYHKAIGAKTIAVPHLSGEDRPGAAGFGATIRTIASFGRLCRDNGIQLLYHNHDFEFITISGQYALDFLYSAIEPEFLATEIDTCWVRYAGEDPVSYLAKYAGRAPIVHLKDYVGKKSDFAPYALIGRDDPVPSSDLPFQFKPFGYGCQDAPAVVRAAIAAGAQWVVVEQDQSNDRPALEAAKMSLETIKSCLA